jgi:hypothetical protein
MRVHDEGVGSSSAASADGGTVELTLAARRPVCAGCRAAGRGPSHASCEAPSNKRVSERGGRQLLTPEKLTEDPA